MPSLRQLSHRTNVNGWIVILNHQYSLALCQWKGYWDFDWLTRATVFLNKKEAINAKMYCKRSPDAKVVSVRSLFKMGPEITENGSLVRRPILRADYETTVKYRIQRWKKTIEDLEIKGKKCSKVATNMKHSLEKIME